mgnify:CR=1 FL=1
MFFKILINYDKLGGMDQLILSSGNLNFGITE